eukprot:COSAG02_NODE_4350_length_5463_cov_2.614840_6_plen_91_part_00
MIRPTFGWNGSIISTILQSIVLIHVGCGLHVWPFFRFADRDIGCTGTREPPVASAHCSRWGEGDRAQGADAYMPPPSPTHAQLCSAQLAR